MTEQLKCGCGHTQEREGGVVIDATSEDGNGLVFKNGLQFLRFICKKCKVWIGDFPLAKES